MLDNYNSVYRERSGDERQKWVSVETVVAGEPLGVEDLIKFLHNLIVIVLCPWCVSSQRVETFCSD